MIISGSDKSKKYNTNLFNKFILEDNYINIYNDISRPPYVEKVEFGSHEEAKQVFDSIA